MKISKKLISAIVMLTLSFVMLVTSSFAWFSMNVDVSAKGMTVTAKGDQIYLEIINEEQDFSTITGQTSVSAPTATAKKENLKPTTPVQGIKDGNATQVDPYDGEASVKWVTNTSNGIDQWQASQVYSYADDTYYLVNKFKIRLNPDTGAETANPLRVSNVKFAETTKITADFAKCVSVLVVCGNKSQLWTQATTKGVFEDDAESAPNLSANNEGKFDNTTDGVEVAIYIFFNGNDATCTISNLKEAIAASENNYTVEVSFSVQ